MILVVLFTALLPVMSGILFTGCSRVDAGNGPSGNTPVATASEYYNQLWKEVSSYQRKGLPKSALKVVNRVYRIAKEENNAGQLVKALLHRVRYLQEVEEDTFVKIQKNLSDELKNSRFPVTPVLHSLLAEQYWTYYQNNRYRLLRRTTTADNFKQEDLRTWDAKRIVDAVMKHYSKSLEQTPQSKKTKIDLFDVILHKGYNGRQFRPTLYDFLAHRAVDFYKDFEAGLTKPRYQFTLNDDSYLSDTKAFARMKIQTRDPMSFDYFAITYLQDLARFHLNDADPAPLVDVELKRLKYVYQTAVISNKDIIYEKQLRRMIEKYNKHKVTAQIYHELASLYNRLGDNYKAGYSDDYKWHKKKAHELCREAIAKYPGSIGASHCQALINRIEAKKLQLTQELAVTPQKPFKTLLKYRNMDRVFLKLVKTSNDELEKNRRMRQKDMVAHFAAKDPVKTWRVSIANDGDFQSHAVELHLDGLTNGMYVLLAATSENFGVEKNAVSYSFFHVSNIAYVHRKLEGAGWEFHLLHRHTGQPLNGASAQVWYREYNRSQRRYVQIKGERYQADADGFFEIRKKNTKQNYFHLEFIHGNDRLKPKRNFSMYRSYTRRNKYNRTIFFTDRSIYRPGQTLYFKGIMLEVYPYDGEKSKILPDYPTTVTLYDVNHQKVASLNLRSNEYGTFSGSFVLPTGRLNGLMKIAGPYGNVRFRMEEYKRPKFNVTFKPLEKSYRLKDNVKVTGQAKAYAGYNIDNAEVKYRVVRNVFYPYPWYYRYWFGGYLPSSSPMEIANGYTKTRADGSFDVTFDATPDLTISKKTRPAFTFTVYADITDINGETRSGRKAVYIGYEALKLSVNLPARIDKNQGKLEAAMNTTTLSGGFIPAKGNIEIFKLKEPGRFFRPRKWQKPDTFTMEKKQFYSRYPHDLYSDENLVHKWKKEKKVFAKPFDTAVSKTLALDRLKSWKPGRYLLEMSAKDRFDNPVKQIKYFTIYSSTGARLPFFSPDWFAAVKGSAEPGEQAVFLIGSSDFNVRVLYEIEHREKIVQKRYFTLKRGQKRIEIPIKEEHRGNLAVHFTFVRRNRFYTHTQVIHVPWSNKKLDISFETFRNKLLPGEKEEWRIKIKGPKSDQVAAEMVAALYDASLDAFMPHHWNFSVFPSLYPRHNWLTNPFFNVTGSRIVGRLQKYTHPQTKSYDRINWFGFYWRPYSRLKHKRRQVLSESVDASAPAAPAEQRARPAARRDELADVTVGESKAAGFMAKKAVAGKKEKKKNGEKEEEDAPAGQPSPEPVKVRTNFNETAFFYPHLRTTPQGEIIVAFTVPEALTKWKMMGFAHTKSLQYGFAFNELVTQKELMVVPNAPRFFREGDSLVFTSKITNLSEKALSGTSRLQLLDAVTMKPVDTKFKKQADAKPFKVKKGESALVSWKLAVPEDLDAVTYRITARAGAFSDGEEKALPILKNRMLVTESMPLPVRALQTKQFKFKKLIGSASSNTLRHKRLTLEFTSNPVWYAVQALPYLMEYPHECLEQTFSRYYANSLASFVVNADPKIKRVFDLWKNAVDSKDSPNANALLSNLQKNQELKSLLLQETPWVLNGKNETQRKRRVALLFDLNSMAAQLGRALKKLKEGQMASGGWPWFKGMKESRYITQHIVCGFAHLGVLKAMDIKNNKDIYKMMKEAVPYLDRQITKDYQWLIRNDIDLDQNSLRHVQVHYLYARSYFQDIPMHSGDKKAFQYYKAQVKKYWTDFHANKYMQGMMALIMKRYNETETAVAIADSIKEHALYSEEMGMYWKYSYGYYWYQMPIETHALLIEVFDEVMNDEKSVDELKTWLLKQKQTQDWRTTKATAEACFALLLKGDQWLKESRAPEITIGKTNPITIIPGKYGPGDERIQAEAGTGYFKTAWTHGDITPDMGHVTVKNNNKIVAWGSLYWQYFENLDKITPAKTPLHLKKKLFVEKPSDTGPVIHPVSRNTKLKVGDRIKVRIELRVDRNMEYVHMKDMRASTLEPEHVISGYRWQDRLGYYQTTKDASTNFFFDYLPKGTYVFEYPLRITHEGNFSNGITTIQCMYAPEFTSHSEGVRVNVKNK
jgi:hypothetical protein